MSDHITRRRFWLLAALGLTLAALTGTSFLGSSTAAPAAVLHLQDEMIIEPLGHFGGWMASVAVPPGGGDYVYLGEGSGFTVLDVSDTGQPRQVGSLPLSGTDVADIALVGATAYLANGYGLQVVDLSEPISPTLVGELDLPGTAHAVGVADSYAYVAAAVGWNDGWLYAVDVSNPAAPLLAGNYDTPGTARGIYAAGSTAYVADGDSGLLILDVSDPASPSPLGAYDTLGSAVAVQVVGATAYVADGASGLQILDVSNPANPTLLGSYDTTGWAQDVQVVDSTAYVADGSSGLQILDVSNPATPAPLGASNAGWRASKVAVFNTRAYVAAETRGLRILNVSNPASPGVLGDYERPTAVMDVIVDHPYGYIAGWDKLWVLDMTDPALPVPLGASGLQDVVGGRRLSLSPHPQTGDPLAYVAEQYYGLEIINVTDPYSPTLTGQYPVPNQSEVNDVFVAGQYAYVPTVSGPVWARTDGWLRILDVSDPANPTEAVAYDTPGDARRVFVADGIAYVADGEAGLRFIDVSAPASPVEVGYIDPPAGAATDVVFVDGDRAFVGSNAETGWWLRAFDVSDPANPTLLAEQQGAGQVNDIDVDEEHVYLAVTGGSVLMHSLTASDLVGPNQPGQDTANGMHVYRRNDLTSEGRYRTEGADSVHRYSISIAGIRVTFVIIDKKSWGSEIVGIPGAPQCSVFGIIDPEKAKTDGCTMSPEGAHPCQCGTEEIPFTGSATNGWEFIGFNPQPPIKCPARGQKQVVAQFGPALTISGGGDENLCVGDEENVRIVLRFSLLASQADHWEVGTFIFEASGDGDDAKNVKHVKLFHEGTQKGGTKNYSKDNGTVEFVFSKIKMPAGGPAVNFTLEYTLDYEGMEECGTDFRDFLVSLKQHDILPQNYRPGVLSGGAAGGASIGCVMHEDAEGNFIDIFDAIQDAVDAASSGMNIALCPGMYKENVDVEQSVRIHSVGSHGDTAVKAEDANDHVFHVKKNDTTIEDLAIDDANGAGKAGIYVHGSTVSKVKIIKNAIMGHHHGIFLDSVKEAEIKDNHVLSNEGHGIYLKSSTESTVKGNSVSFNGEDGIYMEDCQEAAGKETKITNSNSFRKNKKNGIHLQQSKGVTIEDNTSVSENEQHGVFLENSEDVKIINNSSIKQNDKDGIKIDNSKGIEIKDNPRILQNTEKGISVYNCTPSPDGKTVQIQSNSIEGYHRLNQQKIGIYVENSQDVVIGQQNQGNTILNHLQHGVSVVNCPLGLTIEGNTFIHNTDSGIHLKSSCSNTIQHNTANQENGDGLRVESCQCAADKNNSIVLNTIEQNTRHGIYLENSYGNEIGKPGEANTIKSNEVNGISLKDCEAPEGQPNKIRANIVQENKGDGIYLGGSKRNVISDVNQIIENHKQGIHMVGSAFNEVNDNKIFGEYRQKNGIYLDGCSSASIENNEIKEHREDGIYVEDGGRKADESIDIIGNTIKNSKDNGIELYNSCRTHIGMESRANTIEASDWEAIKLIQCRCSDEEKNHIAANTIKNTDNIHDTAHGIHVDRSRGAMIGPDNKIESNDGNGVYLNKSSAIEVFRNFIWDNENGIHLRRCQAAQGSENEILNNTIEENAEHGIYLERSYGTKIGQPGGPVNTIRLNDRNGIHLEHCSSSTAEPANSIVNNVIKDENKHGIYLLSSHNNLIKANEIRANKKDGIHLKQSNKNKIHENVQVVQNQWYGIYLKWSEENEIAGNEVVDNKKSGIFLYEANSNKIPDSGQKANKITLNDIHGIRLDNSQKNDFYNNEITSNDKDGIRLNNCRRNRFWGELTIAHNKGSGILLDGSTMNQIEGPRLVCSGKKCTYKQNIHRNGQYGVYFRNHSDCNWLERFRVYRHGTGIMMESSNYNQFKNVYVFGNGVGLHEKNSKGSNYRTGCWFVFNGVPYIPSDDLEGSHATGIYLENSSPEIAGAIISGDEGDGIRSEGGSNPLIRKCSIHDNDSAALNNLDPAITISAQDNWWGDASGPGGAGPGAGDEISGTVDFANWRPISVTLVAVADQDPLLAARGATDANPVHVHSWEVFSDTVRVTLADSLGWLVGPETFTVTLEGPAATVPVSFTVPAGAAIGAGAFQFFGKCGIMAPERPILT